MFFLGDIMTRKLDLPKPGQALPGRDRAIPTASTHYAVSYTHLTLPTIYSV